MMNHHDRGDQYYQALGLFIDTFAEVESWLLILLQIHIGASPKISKVVLSGVRIDQAISNIRRIHDATDKRLDHDLDEALLHLAEINRVRNDIVHFGTKFLASGKRVSTNERQAIAKNRVRSTEVSAAVLSKMSADLLTIIKRLKFFVTESLGDDEPRYKSDHPDCWHSTWRYKPAPQGRARDKSRQNRPRQPRQQTSSPK